MALEFYHLSPVILTDTVFFDYVPTCHNTGTANQRQAAYLVAEQQMMEHLGTFLLPTTVTGIFMWPNYPRPLILPVDRLISIPRIKVTSFKGTETLEVQENDADAIVRDGRGVIDALVTAYPYTRRFDDYGGNFYQAIVTMQAGLPTGVSAVDKSLHHGLALAAETALNEIVDPGSNEGGPGDPGIKQWGSLGYSETRYETPETPFGRSPRAGYIVRLVRHLKRLTPASTRMR